MKLETTIHEDQQAEIVVEFDAAEFDTFKQRAARKIAQQAKIPGFRPGKAPYSHILRLYGEEAIEQEAIEILLDDQYPKVLEQAQIEPSGPGALKNIISRNPLKLAFLVPLRASIDLKNYQDIRQSYELKPTTDEDIEATIRRIQTSYATAEPVERAAEIGDLVYVKLSARILNPADGQNADLLPEESTQFTIDQDDKEDLWPFPGFSKNLTGLSANDEKLIQYTFPEESENEDLRGKNVEYKVVVESVKHLILPELNDEFIASLGEFKSIEDLRTVIRKQLEDNARRDYESEYFETLIGKIAEQAEIKYPPQMLEEEVNHLLEHLGEDLAERSMDLEAYFKLMQTTREKFIEEEVKPAAIKRLIRSLVIDEVGRAEKIEIADSDQPEVSSMTLATLQNYMKDGKNKKVTEEMINSATYNAMMIIYNRKVMLRLKARANGEEIVEPVVEPPSEPTEEAAETEEQLASSEEETQE